MLSPTWKSFFARLFYDMHIFSLAGNLLHHYQHHASEASDFTELRTLLRIDFSASTAKKSYPDNAEKKILCECEDRHNSFLHFYLLNSSFTDTVDHHKDK